MRCRKCGEEIENGLKICPSCGTPVLQSALPSGGQPVRRKRQSAAPQKRPNPEKEKKRLRYISYAAVSSMAAMTIFFLCGITVSMSSAGSMSIPMIFVSSVLGGLSALPESANAGLAVYVIFTVITLMLFIASVFLLINRNRIGVYTSIAASALMLIMCVIVIIAAFMLHAKFGDATLGGTISPSVWTWLGVPVSVCNGLYIFFMGKKITKRRKAQ